MKGDIIRAKKMEPAVGSLVNAGKGREAPKFHFLRFITLEPGETKEERLLNQTGGLELGRCPPLASAGTIQSCSARATAKAPIIPVP